MAYEFPSGPWRGYWLYPDSAARHKMRLNLKFAACRMMGDGDDEIGYFVINGKYDAESGQCSWTKTYPRSHQVWYVGRRDARGVSGEWVIHGDSSGGFSIWPGESEEGFVDETEETEPDAIERAVPASPSPRRAQARPQESSRFGRCSFFFDGKLELWINVL